MARNNILSGSKRIGGNRQIFSHEGIALLVGGFNLPLESVPLVSTGNFIPAGTPIQVDEIARTAKVFKSAQILTGVTTATEVDVVKMTHETDGRNPFVVGDIVMVLANNKAADATGTGVTITDIDTTDPDKDTITVSANITGDKDAFLVLASAVGASKAPAVLPNAIAPYDIVRHPDATYVSTEACFSTLKGMIYRRRVPVIPEQVIKYMRENDCFFRWSNSK